MTARLTRPHLKPGRKRDPHAKLSNLDAAVRYELDRARRDENGCWNTHRSVCRGYPIIGFRLGGVDAPRKTVTIYRLIMLWKDGPKPDGMEVRHLCGNPRCVNPDHLVYGTRAANAHDRLVHGTMPKLNLRQVRDIRSRYIPRRHVDGRYVGRANTRELAEEYGVSLRTIRNVATGRTHQWLE